MQQKKKRESDPDFENINPDLLALATNNKFVKNLIELFLIGELTWTEALEAMVMILAKEMRADRKLLNQTLSDALATTRTNTTPALSDKKKTSRHS